MKHDFLKFFETEKEEENGEKKTIKEHIIKFFKGFPYKSFQYQVVWSIRLLLWLLILLLALYGAVIRIKDIF